MHVLPDAIGTDTRVYLVYVDRTFLDPKIRAFVDLVADHFESLARAGGPT